MPEHYTVKSAKGEGMRLLRELFPEAKADEMNFCLFSTSGVHGSYQTIEDEEKEPGEGVTFLVIHPRMCAMVYGNAKLEAPEDFQFLKDLRASSKRVVVEDIGGGMSQSESSESIKPCPFCGGEARLLGEDDGWSNVGCEALGCFAKGPCDMEGKEAIRKWNERVDMPM